LEIQGPAIHVLLENGLHTQETPMSILLHLD